MPGIQLPTTRVLSIDPGTTNLGWAIGEYTFQPTNYNVLAYDVLQATKAAKKQKEDVLFHGQRLIALDIVEQEIIKLIKKFQPRYVVTEDTYFNSRTPQAYAALLLCIHVIHRTLLGLYRRDELKYESAGRLYKLAPSTIKLIATNKSTSDKNMIMTSLLENPEVTFSDRPVLKEEYLLSGGILLSEHAADAICAGYSFAKTEMEQILINDLETERNKSVEQVVMDTSLVHAMLETKKKRKS